MDPFPILLVVALIGIGVGVGVLLRGRPSRPTGVDVPMRLTPHAVERMAERGVVEDDIRATLANPDRVVASTYRDRGPDVDAGEGAERDSVRLEKNLRGRTLKVWVPVDWRSQVPVAVKSVAWQYTVTFRIPGSRAGAIIGRGGQTIRDLERTYRVRIAVDAGLGLAHISGDDGAAVQRARRHVARLVA